MSTTQIRAFLRKKARTPSDLFLAKYRGETVLFVPDAGGSALPRSRRFSTISTKGDVRSPKDGRLIRSQVRLGARSILWDETRDFRRRVRSFFTTNPTESEVPDQGLTHIIDSLGVRDDGSVGGGFTARYIEEAKKRLRGNLCVNTGQGSGGGFTPCSGGPSTEAELKRLVRKIKRDPHASEVEKKHAIKLARAELEINRVLSTRGDTMHRHTKPDGSFTTERAMLHKKIVEQLDNPNAKPQEQPTVVMFGGLPGSGKTSSIGESLGMEKNPQPGTFAYGAVVVDSDAAKALLPEYNGRNASEVHRESSHIAQILADKAVARKQNIILDGTFKDVTYMGSEIQRFREAGYRIEIRFAELPVEKSRERAVARFLKSGRYVPTGFIQSLQSGNTSINRKAFEALKGKADGYMIMDTDVPFGAPAKLIDRSGKLV